MSVVNQYPLRRAYAHSMIRKERALGDELDKRTLTLGKAK